MPINWREELDDNDNTYWEGDSPYTDDDVPIRWRLVQRLEDNVVRWHSAHDSELGNLDEAWKTLELAKESCQRDHDNIVDVLLYSIK